MPVNRQQLISSWDGAAGGTQDNYPELLSKCKANFADIYKRLPGPDYVNFFDDFEGPTLTTKLAVIAGSDPPAAGAINVQQGGVLRLTTGDSNASLAADGVQVSGSLNWKASAGGLVFDTRLKVSSIATIQFFAGLTDQTASLEMPVTLSTTVYTTVASDAVGFLFDTDATVDTIRLVGVAADVDAIHQDTAIAPVAATYLYLRIEVSATGVATFYINGVQVGTAMLAAVTPGTFLAPVIAVRSKAAASYTADVDYLLVEAARV